jgi:hypothetical protein
LLIDAILAVPMSTPPQLAMALLVLRNPRLKRRRRGGNPVLRAAVQKI